MIAVDANIVLRLILDDDQAQVAAARRLLASNRLLITSCVIIEAEWVLRSAFRWSRERINGALVALTEFSNVVASAPDELAWALERHADGGDLADMMHIAAARDTERFVTLDRGALKGAGERPPVPVELLAG